MVSGNDWNLFVAISPSLFIGTAQTGWRWMSGYLPQQERVSKVGWFPIHNGSCVYNRIDDEGSGFISPHFGSWTFASNYYVKEMETEDNIFQGDIVKISHPRRLEIGTSLIAVTMEDNKLSHKVVKIVPIAKCKNIFDPERVYLIVNEEQFCTEQITMNLKPVALRKGNEIYYVSKTLSSLVFIEDNGTFFLIGIESKAAQGYSLSTYLPYHCQEIEEIFEETVCNKVKLTASLSNRRRSPVLLAPKANPTIIPKHGKVRRPAWWIQQEKPVSKIKQIKGGRPERPSPKKIPQSALIAFP